MSAILSHTARALAAGLLLTAASTASAVPFTDLIAVETTSSYFSDPVEAYPILGGEITHIASVVPTTTLVSPAPAPPVGPTALTDIGDEAFLWAEGANDLDYVSIFGLDNSTTVTNNGSLAYWVDLSVSYSYLVDASPGDVYSQADFSLLETLTGVSTDLEIMGSSRLSDSLYGNEVDGNPAPGFGGSLSDGDSAVLSYLLNPGDELILAMTFTADGGAFEPGLSLFDVNYSIAVTGVRAVEEPPEPLPAPGVLALLALPLLMLRRMAKKAA